MTVDASGAVVSVTVTEPRFTLEEKDLLLMSRRKEQSEQRGSHGFLYSDATDPKNMGRFKVPTPMTDFAAKALREEQEAWASHPDADNLLWRVELEA